MFKLTSIYSNITCLVLMLCVVLELNCSLTPLLQPFIGPQTGDESCLEASLDLDSLKVIYFLL